MGMLLLKINFGKNHFENMVGIFSFQFTIYHGGLILQMYFIQSSILVSSR